MNTDISNNSPPTASPVLEMPEDDMLPEYDFDYSKAQRNPYVGKIEARTASVTLAPDVAAVFSTSGAVNAALRVLIQAARGHVPANPEASDPAV